LTIDTDNDGVPDQADGIISGTDRKVIGSTIPRFVFGSSINMEWKNFDLNLQVQGVMKKTVHIQGAFIENGCWEGFALEIGADYYSAENTDARFARPQKHTNKNNQPSSWWMINGAYLRLKNLQLGYTIPKNISSKIGISNARVYVGGTNLLTLSKTKEWGIDAETVSGRAMYHYQVKTYVFGITLDF
jgi:hypothetical protein